MVGSGSEDGGIGRGRVVRDCAVWLGGWKGWKGWMGGCEEGGESW